jgi:hypothetical protein
MLPQIFQRCAGTNYRILGLKLIVSYSFIDIVGGCNGGVGVVVERSLCLLYTYNVRTRIHHPIGRRRVVAMVCQQGVQQYYRDNFLDDSNAAIVSVLENTSTYSTIIFHFIITIQ